VVEENIVENEKQEFQQVDLKSNNNGENYHWRDLLKHIESMPSRAFYSSLAHPICLTSEKVVISFKKDIFVKQARDKNKSQAFYDACKKYFGVENLEIDVKLKNDVYDEKINLSEISEEKPLSSIQEQEEEKISQSELDAFEDETDKNKQIQEEKQYFQSEDLSDQEKMIVNLFDGKIIA